MVMDSEDRRRLYAPYVEILHDCRVQQTLSQTRLAENVSLSAKYVTLIESGRRVPTPECLLALMASVGVARKTALELVTELVDQFEWQE